MVQVKGMPRPLVQRFSRDFAGRVKYSTLWPSRSDSPSAASRAMPTSGNFSGSTNKGKVGIFAFCSSTIELRNDSVKRKAEGYIRPAKCPLPAHAPGPARPCTRRESVSAIAENKSSRNEYRGKDKGNRDN